MIGPQSLAEMFGAGAVDTFLGLPACVEPTTLDASIALLGAPCVTPYPSVGPYCAGAPAAIRAAIAPYAASAHHMDFDLGRPIFPDGCSRAVDCGDLPYSETDFAANRARLQGRVETLLERGAVPVLLGGDDSAPIPLIAAYGGRGPLTILQIDAHIDWRDEVDGERHGLSSNMRRASEMSHVERIVQVGQWGIGSARQADYEDALAWGVDFFPARGVHGNGIGPVLEAIPEGSQVLIAVDIDGLDPTVVPGVIGRGPGGLDYWQSVNLIHAVAAKARIAGFSLVEFMPQKDLDGLGALVAARIIANVLGLLAVQP